MFLTKFSNPCIAQTSAGVIRKDEKESPEKNDERKKRQSLIYQIGEYISAVIVRPTKQFQNTVREIPNTFRKENHSCELHSSLTCISLTNRFIYLFELTRANYLYLRNICLSLFRQGLSYQIVLFSFVYSLLLFLESDFKVTAFFVILHSRRHLTIKYIQNTGVEFTYLLFMELLSILFFHSKLFLVNRAFQKLYIEAAMY